MTGRRLTTEEKNNIVLGAAQGKTAFAISREIGRSENTVMAALKKPESALAVQDIQTRLADKFEQVTERILDAVSDADIAKADLKSKMISAGVGLDKARVIKGQASATISVLFQVSAEAEAIRRRGTVVDAEVLDDEPQTPNAG